MKKILLFLSLALVFWTCKNELDILDKWKETTIVYGLLDQTQPKQYIRIEKAFLGPDNALAMAQQYDSINYAHQLSVWLQELDANGSMITAYALAPDTLTTKDSGMFNFPEQVIYSMNTPLMDPSHKYKIVIDNNQTGNHVESTTHLVEDFNVTRPSTTTIGLVQINTTTKFTVEWQGSASARIYQVGMKFHYYEIDVNGDTTFVTTPEWVIGSVVTDGENATTLHTVEFAPNDFYRFIRSVVPDNPLIVKRKDNGIDFTVYGGGEELYTYMQVNAPSSSIVQEKPYYTNIENGYGVFSSRISKSKSGLSITPQTEDSLARGQFTCPLKFEDRNGAVPGCQ